MSDANKKPEDWKAFRDEVPGITLAAREWDPVSCRRERVVRVDSTGAPKRGA